MVTLTKGCFLIYSQCVHPSSAASIHFNTSEHALNDTCSERRIAIYGHFSLSDLVFHVYFMADLSKTVPGHILGNLYGINNTWQVPFVACLVIGTLCTGSLAHQTWFGSWKYPKLALGVSEPVHRVPVTGKVTNGGCHIWHEISYIKSVLP